MSENYPPLRGPERVMLVILCGAALAVISTVVYVLGWLMGVW